MSLSRALLSQRKNCNLVNMIETSYTQNDWKTSTPLFLVWERVWQLYCMFCLLWWMNKQSFWKDFFVSEFTEKANQVLEHAHVCLLLCEFNTPKCLYLLLWVISPGALIFLEPVLRQFEVFNIRYAFVKNAETMTAVECI